MDTVALLARFREDMKDTIEPYLWTDADIFAYMTEAQDLLCRMTYGIADGDSANTIVPIVATEPYVAIIPQILKIRAARLHSTGKELTILNYEDLEFGSWTTTDDYGCPTQFRLQDTPGPIRAIVVGMTDNKARLIDVPIVDDQLNLLVYRMPVISDDGMLGESNQLEIDSRHHIYLLYQMKAIALRVQDAETFDKLKADEYEAKFAAYCDKVKQEQERREHKYRTVAYGGI